jgi:hypothetical protein
MPDLRDQLADIIQRAADPQLIDNDREDLEDAAAAIIAEGWCPPPRRIETAEELRALPLGSLILVNGVACHKQRNSKGALWRAMDLYLLWTSSQVARQGVATILHIPEEAANE